MQVIYLEMFIYHKFELLKIIIDSMCSQILFLVRKMIITFGQK